MNIVDKSCVEFIEVLSSREPVPGGGGAAAFVGAIGVALGNMVEVLSSREPVPGGGGAAAFVGAIGVALGNMVANLTIGKKKYAEYEEEIKELLKEAKEIEAELERNRSRTTIYG